MDSLEKENRSDEEIESSEEEVDPRIQVWKMLFFYTSLISDRFTDRDSSLFVTDQVLS